MYVYINIYKFSGLSLAGGGAGRRDGRDGHAHVQLPQRRPLPVPRDLRGVQRAPRDGPARLQKSISLKYEPSSEPLHIASLL